MLYAFLSYEREDVVESRTPQHDAAVTGRLAAVTGELARAGRLGPFVRLMPTTTATTVREGRGTVVLDAPALDTKEQLHRLFIVECASLEQAITTAKDLGQAYGASGCVEIRPLCPLPLHVPQP